VKQEFIRLSRGRSHGENGPADRTPEEPAIRIITRKPLTPQPDELHLNPRARSAKLRVAEKL